MKRWNKLVEDRTLLSIILAGTIVLTMVTVGIVMRSNNGNDDGSYIGMEESSSDSYLASGNESSDTDMTSDSENMEQAGANDDYVQASLGDETSLADAESSTEETDMEQEEAESQTTAVVLQFGDTGVLTWPIAGNILREYSMDHTVYHATLEQYKVSPAVLIQGEPGETVVSPAIGQITEVGYDAEIGNYVVLNIGSGYEAIIGQLDEITVAESQYVTEGTPLGVVAEPTIYSTVEGPNVYFRLNKDGEAVDPIDYLE